MPRITVTLSEAMFAELESAVAEVSNSRAYGPEKFATEAVEVCLASRRLERFGGSESKSREPHEYHLLLPEARTACC